MKTTEMTTLTERPAVDETFPPSATQAPSLWVYLLKVLYVGITDHHILGSHTQRTPSKMMHSILQLLPEI